MIRETIIIVGATGGVGSTLAKRLVAQGKSVHLVGRDLSSLEELGHHLGGASFAVADVVDEIKLSQAIRAGIQNDSVKGLIYCVGTLFLKPLLQCQRSDFEEHFAINCLGAVRSIQSCLKELKSSSGSVVLFSSVAARRGFAQHAVTGSVKAAIEGLVVSLAAELAPEVRVNAIAPSLTRSKMSAPLLGNKSYSEAIAKLHPLKRLGTSEDLAQAAEFLLSDQSAWITGQILGVDGGRSTLS